MMEKFLSSKNQSQPDISFSEKMSSIMMERGTKTIYENIVEVSACTEVMTNVVGFIGLSAAPYYGLTLEIESENELAELPLTPVDSANYICHWINAIGKKVHINQLLVVFEIFHHIEKTEEDQLPFINVMAEWNHVYILQETPTTLSTPFSDSKEESDKMNYPSQSCSSATLTRILVQYISMPFYIDGPPAFCLFFVSFINSVNVGSKEYLWLILRAEQVCWREFLVPNREYFIKFPSDLGEDYLEKSKKPLNVIFKKLNRELIAILHHKPMFHTLHGCQLPKGSRVFLTGNSDFSKSGVPFFKNPFVTWFSTSEAEHANAELVSFYGQVEKINYTKELVFNLNHCYLCVNASPKEPTLMESQCLDFQPWTDPWKSMLTCDEDLLVELPCAAARKKGRSNIMETGVPENLVQIITLRDIVTGDEKCIYLKHSFIPNMQRLFRLTKGMVVCITHLNRRKSAAGKYYFLTTPLSSFRVLTYDINTDSICENWGVYGLSAASAGSQGKIWGVLQFFNISKISISVKCSGCRTTVYKDSCSNLCDSKAFVASAHALGWLQITQDMKSFSMEKVIIKDKHVSTLLCIPDKVWEVFLEAARDEEMVWFPNGRQEWNNPKGLNGLFNIYCNLSKRSGRFYISVRKMSSLNEEGPVYFCIQLEPINKSRLDTVATLVRKEITSRRQ